MIFHRAGAGGSGIKKLRDETGADISVDEPSRPERKSAAKDDEEGDDKAKKPRGPRGPPPGIDIPAGQALVTFRGEPEAVAAALAAVQALISAFTSLRIPVNGYVIASLIGNKGEAIAALQVRARHRPALSFGPPQFAGASFTCVGAASPRRHGLSHTLAWFALPAPSSLPPSTHSRPQKETEATIDVSREAPPPGAASSGKGGKGPRLTAADGAVVLSGAQPAVDAAAEKIRALVASHTVATVALPDPGAAGEVVGKGGEAVKAFQARSSRGTQLRALYARCCARFAAPAASAALSFRVSVVSRTHPPTPVFRVFPLPHMQAEHGLLDVEVDKEGGVVKLVGPAEALPAAAAALTATIAKYAAGA